MDLSEAARLVQSASDRTQAARAELVRSEAERDAYLSGETGTPALRCTACGGRISPETEWRGPAYLSAEVVVGFSCDEWRCGAEWDRDGAVTSPSKLASA